MLNAESRKYYSRAFCASGTAFNPFSNLCLTDHVKAMQDCYNIYVMDALVEFMKTATATTLQKCVNPAKSLPFWSATIEYQNAPAAFLTKTPDEIYETDDPPIIDTIFSLTSQVKFRPS